MSGSVTIDLSVDFRLVKPVHVRKRELLVKTKKKNTNLLAEAQRYRAVTMITISINIAIRFLTLFNRSDANWPW